MHRYSDGSCLVGNASGDCLSDPPCGIGAELVALAVLEFLDSLDQTDVSFLNEVEEMKSSVCVLLGNRNNETQVGLNQAVLCGLEHLHAPLDLIGLGKNHIAVVLELELDLAEASDCGLILGDQILDFVQCHAELGLDGKSLGSCDQISGKLSDFLIVGNLQLILQDQAVVLQLDDVMLGGDESVGEHGDFLGLDFNLGELLQKIVLFLDQFVVMKDFLAGGELALLELVVVLHCALAFLEALLVEGAVSFLLRNQLFLILCVVVLCFLVLCIELLENLGEACNHNSGLLDDVLDDQSALFHLLRKLDFLVGCQKGFSSDFTEIESDGIIGACFALVCSEDAGPVAYGLLDILVDIGHYLGAGAFGEVFAYEALCVGIPLVKVLLVFLVLILVFVLLFLDLLQILVGGFVDQVYGSVFKQVLVFIVGKKVILFTLVLHVCNLIAGGISEEIDLFLFGILDEKAFCTQLFLEECDILLGIDVLGKQIFIEVADCERILVLCRINQFLKYFASVLFGHLLSLTSISPFSSRISLSRSLFVWSRYANSFSSIMSISPLESICCTAARFSSSFASLSWYTASSRVLSTSMRSYISLVKASAARSLNAGSSII